MNNISINCATEEEAALLLKTLSDQDYKWNSGESLLLKDNRWSIYKEQTYYSLNNKRVSFAPKLYFKQRGCDTFLTTKECIRLLKEQQVQDLTDIIKSKKEELIDLQNNHDQLLGEFYLEDNNIKIGDVVTAYAYGIDEILVTIVSIERDLYDSFYLLVESEDKTINQDTHYCIYNINYLILPKDI